FRIAYYNGGPIAGRNGINNVLFKDPTEPSFPHSTRNGRDFDLLLEYTGPSGSFILTHIVAHCLSFDVVTAPLKRGLAWVIEEKYAAETAKAKDHIKNYSSNFNGIDFSEIPTAESLVPLP